MKVLRLAAMVLFTAPMAAGLSLAADEPDVKAESRNQSLSPPMTDLGEPRLRSDTRERPGPVDRPGLKDVGPQADPTLDNPAAVQQKDVVYVCRDGKMQPVNRGLEETGARKVPPPGAGTPAGAGATPAPIAADCPAPNQRLEGPATAKTLLETPPRQ